MAEKLRQIECCIFTLTMLPSKVLERRCDLRLAHVRQLCSWLEVYAEGPLSYIKLQAMYKRMAALVSYDFSNSFLIDVIHAPRVYPILDVSLV